MKKLICIVLAALFLKAGALAIEPVGEESVKIAVPSALLMEKSSGTVIYEKNAREKLSPASVTKIMTMLLTVEELDSGSLSLTDMVVCSSRAASMGGSQIWLEEGEKMSVSDLLKAVAVVSANDCAVALAEHIKGSEEAFVSRMNERAAELGMADTHFSDCTGLTDDPEHLTSAYDVALMSRELIGHDMIKQYTTLWMDSLRGGESELTNTNKLVRFYEGATGLKTGFTNRAMYCLSATAEREGTEYIAVVMHGATSDERFESAKTLLNFAFANYAVCPLRSPEALLPVMVRLGEYNSVQPVYSVEEGLLLEKGKFSDLTYEVTLPECVDAPVAQGQVLGELKVMCRGETVAVRPLVADREVEKLTAPKIWARLFLTLFS